VVNTGNGYPANFSIPFMVAKRTIPTMSSSGASSAFSPVGFDVTTVFGTLYGAAQNASGSSSTSYIYLDSAIADADL